MPNSESGSACEEEDVLVFEDEEDDILFLEYEKLAINSAWQPLHAAGQSGNSQPTSAIQQSHRKQQPARDHLRPVSAGRQSLRPSDVRLARSCAGESSAERWSNGEDSRLESASSVAESEASRASTQASSSRVCAFSLRPHSALSSVSQQDYPDSNLGPAPRPAIVLGLGCRFRPQSAGSAAGLGIHKKWSPSDQHVDVNIESLGYSRQSSTASVNTALSGRKSQKSFLQFFYTVY